MNMLSTHAYNLSVKAKSLPNCTLTRAQVYEVIAAYFGQQSYAALKNAADPSKLDKPIPEEAYQRCIQKAATLKQTEDVAAKLAHLVASELEFVNSSHAELINRQVFNYLYCNFDEDDSLDTLPSDHTFEFEGIKIDVPTLFERLRKISRQGNKESRLLEMLWLDAEFSRVYQNDASEHWYKRKLAGDRLGEVQIEWADNYGRMFSAKQALEAFRAATTISDLATPNVEEILTTEDYSLPKQSICYQLDAGEIMWRVIELWEIALDDESKTEIEFLNQWDKLFAFQEPQRDSLAQLAESETDPVKQHAWLEFAKSNDINLEQDDMYLINSYTGEVWEHDFDGPVEGAGYEAISLPPLPPELKPQVSERVEAMLKLQKLIHKL
ncbi:hypothetical protein C8J23_12018 [Shewanella chilikensis]|uniref:Nucleoid-associated protein n=1 Tax=Shewanella chilikensis TaxID=558541 RepID=A0ABX5PLY4_9GAMM|nr:hypothetical protein [Shewanella chilikensis]MCL1152584.1 hypothetical protein [Shewanella chilikensis]PYE57568.1 hypothetical protein C8J23_12018 [Shewanella chilikensis]GGZ46357.1 hypothetical protein GCM10007105_35820 [Shewanella chilikensis]